jgi:hypothetical protein
MAVTKRRGFIGVVACVVIVLSCLNLSLVDRYQDGQFDDIKLPTTTANTSTVPSLTIITKTTTKKTPPPLIPEMEKTAASFSKNNPVIALTNAPSSPPSFWRNASLFSPTPSSKNESASSSFSAVSSKNASAAFEPPSVLNATATALVSPSESKPPKKRRNNKPPPLHVVTKDGKVFSHYFMHIPKSGGAYGFKALTQLFWSNPEMVAPARPKDKQFRPCNVGTLSVKQFAKTYPTSYKGVKCTLWHSEDKYSYQVHAEHVYTIVRDPRQIILSMYFHCTQSKDHQSTAHRMPESLDTWLDAWVNAMENRTQARQNRQGFACYVPIQFQSKYTKFLLRQGNATNTNTTTTIQAAKEDLKNRFDVIGDTAQMAKSICAIHIRYTGLVPSQCNCTRSMAPSSPASPPLGKTNDNSSNALHVLVVEERRKTKEGGSSVSEYNAAKFSHGVKNHGATVETTPRQDEQIAKLAGSDIVLYDVVKQVFAEQVKEIEEEYRVVLCDEFRPKVG